jgi:nicotinamidase-related amidase
MQDAANIKGGFSGKLDYGSKPTLLVIDFQRGFTEEGISPLSSNCDAQIQHTNELIQETRKVGNVIFTIIGYDDNFIDAGKWLKKAESLRTLRRETAACELDPRLDYNKSKDLILYKTQASAFFGTPLSGILATQKTDTLIVAGATTSGCVRASVVDAMQYGFSAFVALDCVADRSPAQHQSNLIDMASKYAEVHDNKQLLAYLHGLCR